MKNVLRAFIALTIFIALQYAKASEIDSHYTVEVFAGIYSSELAGLDEKEIVGTRVGYRFQDHFGVHLNLTYREGEVSLLTNTNTSTELFDWRATAVDFALVWHPKLGGILEPSIYAGPGYASISVDGSLALPNGESLFAGSSGSEDTFTFNAGIGSAIELNEHAYLRIGTRARWYEARGSDDIDTEATLAVGFKFE